MTALLEVEGLVKHFVAARSVFGRPTAFIKAVDGVSFHVDAGKTLALVGESGCGKSTVSRLVLRLIEPDAGSVRFEGRELGALNAGELRAFRRDAQIIFQDPYASLNPRMTVSQILTEPLALHDLVPAPRRRERVNELLRLVGLEPRFARRYPHEFSGGQRQRIAIARALAVEPKLIICDEPVSALDVSIRSQILNLLRDLQDRLGLAYIFVSHDLAVVKHIADRVAVMNSAPSSRPRTPRRCSQPRVTPIAVRFYQPFQCPSRRQSAAASCCKARCRARSIHRRAAASTPAAPTRSSAAASKCRTWWPMAPNMQRPATGRRSCPRPRPSFPRMAAFRPFWKNWSPPSAQERKVQARPGLV